MEVVAGAAPDLQAFGALEEQRDAAVVRVLAAAQLVRFGPAAVHGRVVERAQRGAVPRGCGGQGGGFRVRRTPAPSRERPTSNQPMGGEEDVGVQVQAERHEPQNPPAQLGTAQEECGVAVLELGQDARAGVLQGKGGGRTRT